MQADRGHRGNTSVITIGVLLGLLLALLIGLVALGQSRLRDALLEQAQLGIEKRAVAAVFFINHQQDLLRRAARGPQVLAYLANRDLGMSLDYGLRASLQASRRELERFLHGSRWEGQALFDVIRYVDRYGKVLVTAGQADAPSGEVQYQRVRNDSGTALQVERRDGRALLVLSTPVEYKGRPEGTLVAEFDAGRTLGAILSDRGPRGYGTRVALVGPDNIILVGSNGQGLPGADRLAAGGDLSVLRAPVGETGLSLVALSDITLNHGLITSHWFLAALALVCLVLLAGVFRMLRLNTHNLVLRTQFQATIEQRTLLRDQNERLQREIDRRLASEQKLAHQANYDQLTGLPNRNLALDRLAQAIKWARREGGQVLVLFIDLDRFKQVNDSLGHAAGDELLREAAQRLQSRVRDSDTVSRLGGDEFLVVCPDVPDHGHWEPLGQQMIKVLSAPFYIGDHEFFVGASIGVAAYPDGGDDPEKLLKHADIAMYAAKQGGRNRCAYYDPSMDAVAVEAVRLENNLRHALERNELSLVYQPIVDLSSGRTVAVEALLRWYNPELGNVPPDRFVPVAEETGLIHEIGEWVLHEACRTISAMQPHLGFRVAVNLSSKQFSRPGRLLDCVLQALRGSGLMPSQLELEVTESILIDDRPEINELIHQLDRIGVRLSIDDFGTGYSALNYLQRFPFDVLKIDRSFTRQVPTGAANTSLIRAIIAMAHALGLEVVAEGIEQREQVGFLLIQHCEFGQGYLYSRPLDAHQLRGHLRRDYAIPA